jgi:pilus assembly protein Flp/PilA
MAARGRIVMNLFTYLRARVSNDEGQDLLEYALLVALIAIVCVIAVGTTGVEVNKIFEKITADLFT